MVKEIFFLFALLLLPKTVMGENIATEAGAKKVTLETSEGKIVIELFEKESPISVANFIQYVEESFYNGLIFHRVIPGFVAQGGGFEPGMKMRTPTRPPIKNEAHNKIPNSRGTLAMARSMNVDSATCQFYINLKDNTMLDHKGKEPGHYGYAVFGKVIEGLDVVDKMAAIPTGVVQGFRDVPQKDVVIVKAYVSKSGDEKKEPEEAKKPEEKKKE